MASKRGRQNGTYDDSPRLLDTDSSRKHQGSCAQRLSVGRLLAAIMSFAAVLTSLTCPITLPWATASAALGPDILVVLPAASLESGQGYEFEMPCSDDVIECVQAHGGVQAFTDFMQAMSSCKVSCFDNAIAPCSLQSECQTSGNFQPYEQNSCSRAIHNVYGTACRSCILAPPAPGEPNRYEQCTSCGKECHDNVPGIDSQWREFEQCISEGNACMIQAMRFETTAMLSPGHGLCVEVAVPEDAM